MTNTYTGTIHAFEEYDSGPVGAVLILRDGDAEYAPYSHVSVPVELWQELHAGACREEIEAARLWVHGTFNEVTGHVVAESISLAGTEISGLIGQLRRVLERYSDDLALTALATLRDEYDERWLGAAAALDEDD